MTRDKNPSYPQMLAAWFDGCRAAPPSLPWQVRDATPQSEEEVLVFSSNLDGFHGAGSAGLAMRGDATNNWRNDPEFQALLKRWNRRGPPLSGGHFAELGNPRGPQAGARGRSYAIPTVTKPGARASIACCRDQAPAKSYTIQEGIEEFLDHALENPDDVFLIPRMGVGYAGHQQADIDRAWALALDAAGIDDLPANLIFCDLPDGR